MSFSAVDPPPAAPTVPAALGRLGPPLQRLAGMQGRQLPARPARVVRAPAAAGVEEGARQADALVDTGADLVLAEGGAGPAGLVVLAALLGLEPVAVVGTAGAPGWAARITAVRDGLRAARPHLHDPGALAAALGGDGLAGLAGLLAQCAVRRTPVLLSGAPDVCGAALLADRLAPGAAGWLLAGCSPATQAACTALSNLGLDPLLDLRLDAPEGAELALGLLLAAVDLAAGD